MGLLDRLRSESGPKVAFLGIDGVPYSLLEDHFDEFENLAAIAADGAAGAIDSIVPPESSACWPALTTGVNPGETGVYGFQDRETGTYDTYVPMGRDVQARRLWNRVQAADRESVVMNVPVTFPPEHDPDRMVSGFLSPDLDDAAYPDEFRSFLGQRDYRIDVDARLGHDDDKTAFLEDAYETLDRRFEAFQDVITGGGWDLFFGVFMTTDRVNHFLFGDYDRDEQYRAEFLEFYRTLDTYIGRLRDALPEDTTLVVASDHGFTTQEYEVNMNAWLGQAGYLSYRTDDPDELDDIADETQAYSLIPGRVYINREGREPRGSVADEDYERVRDELATALTELTDPDGTPVIADVVYKEDAFRGPHADIAPDLVAIPAHGFDLKAGFHADSPVFDTGPRNGMHSFENASLFIDDPDATIGEGEVDLYDIAPTILSLLEVEYDRGEFDGASLV